MMLFDTAVLHDERLSVLCHYRCMFLHHLDLLLGTVLRLLGPRCFFLCSEDLLQFLLCCLTDFKAGT